MRAYLESGLGTDPCYVVIKSQVANLKLTALSEEAVSLISSNVVFCFKRTKLGIKF